MDLYGIVNVRGLQQEDILCIQHVGRTMVPIHAHHGNDTYLQPRTVRIVEMTY